MNQDLFDALCRVFGYPLEATYPSYVCLDARPGGIVYCCESQFWTVSNGKNLNAYGFGLKAMMATLLRVSPEEADLWIGETMGNGIAEMAQRSLVSGKTY